MADQNWTTEQRQFMLWLATPKEERAIKTQGGWAKKHGFAQESVSRWKNLPGFMEEVDRYRMRWLDRNMTELMASAVKHVHGGNDRFFKILMELYKDVFNKRQIEVKKVDEKEVRKKTEEELVDGLLEIIKRGDPNSQMDKDTFMQIIGNAQFKQRQGEA